MMYPEESCTDIERDYLSMDVRLQRRRDKQELRRAFDPERDEEPQDEQQENTE